MKKDHCLRSYIDKDAAVLAGFDNEKGDLSMHMALCLKEGDVLEILFIRKDKDDPEDTTPSMYSSLWVNGYLVNEVEALWKIPHPFFRTKARVDELRKHQFVFCGPYVHDHLDPVSGFARLIDFPLPEVAKDVQLGDVTAFPEPNGPYKKRFQVKNRQGLHDHFFGPSTEELLKGSIERVNAHEIEWKLVCDSSMFDTINEKEEWEKGAESQLW